MQKLVIVGGKHLSGEIVTQGAKNAVLPVLAACILCGSDTRLANCPAISDRYGSARILTSLGCDVKINGSDMTVDCTSPRSTVISEQLMRTMRSSIIFMGALLGRFGKCTLCYPGGCDLGPRPIDMHISALRKMGAKITDEYGVIECTADKLHGCKISLSFPSVGTTENIILAAVLADGETVISNCAREPEICCLCDFLRSCGARIKGDGGGKITVEGVEKLSQPQGEVFHIIPDRIAAATYMSCVACAGGELLVTKCAPWHLDAVMPIFEQSGCYVRSYKNSIYIRKNAPLKSADTIRTMVYPGFPTDLQAVIMAPLCTAEGTTVFVENIFENRYRHVNALRRMGADIKAEGKVAVVTGVKELFGVPAEAPDLRGGAALVCAALGAHGISEITRTEFIDRGYENIEKNLTALGGSVTRISE